MIKPVVIINPADAVSNYQGLASEFTAIEPPLMARLLANYLDYSEIPAIIIDGQLQPNTAQLAKDADPALIAVTVYGHQPSASTQTMPAAIELCKELTEVCLGVAVLVTGTHPAALPEQMLRETGADFVATGEGFIATREIYRFLSVQPNWRYITPPQGLCYWDHDEPVRTDPEHNLIHMSDVRGAGWRRLPELSRYRAHNWHTLGYAERAPYASMLTSLGCPFTCLAGSTPVNTVYGQIPIKNLVDQGMQEIPVFTFDPDTKQGLVATATNIGCYGKNKKLVRVNFDDGTYIDCTPDHQFLEFKWGNGKSRSKQWVVEAQNLKPGAHVRALRFENPVGYPVAAWTRYGRQVVHRLVAEWMIGRKLLRTEHVHHIDHDKKNWRPENLEVHATTKDHFARHPEISERMRRNNPAKNMTPEWRAKITAKQTGLKRSEKAKERYRQASFRREAAKAGQRWWTTLDGKIYRSNLPRGQGDVVGRPKGLFKWWTSPEGVIYQAREPRSADDVKGRIEFNPIVNHRVVSVMPLDGLHDVYCLTVPSTGWFYANNVLVKNCSFCCIQTPFREGDQLTLKGKANSYRMWSPIHVVNELEVLVSAYGVKHVKIADEMFLLNRRHVEGICAELERRGLSDKDLNMWFYSRVDTVGTDRALLERMRRCGFTWAALGIEAADQDVLGAVDKRDYDNVGALKAVRALQGAGINVIGNYIFGLPKDTEVSMAKTLNLAVEINTEWVNFYSAVAYPGSSLYAEMTAKGWKPPPWSAYSFHAKNHQPLGTETLTPAQVLDFRDWAYRHYMSSDYYQNTLRDKFGAEAVLGLQRMLAVPLEREGL